MAVQKALSSGAPSVGIVAKNLGIPMTTLFGWKQKYGMSESMKKNRSKSATKKELTSEEKLQAIINQASMPENEFGEYLRLVGLHSVDVENFKKEYFNLLNEKGRAKQHPEVAILHKEKKDLQNNLNRKDKALAEMSARIVLLKKSHLLWGDPEDVE